ncbi:MAG: chemotaxis protein CheW [Nanoarchaeota archaeon]
MEYKNNNSDESLDTKKKYSERQLVVFSLGNEEFGVDINEVNSIIKLEPITKIPNSFNFIEGVINLRGKIVVIINLARKLGLPTKENDKDTRIIIIETKDQNNKETMIGMIVDHSREAIRLSEDQIEPAPPLITQRIKMDYLEGVGIIENRLLILLDLAKVLCDNEITNVQNLSKTSKDNNLNIENDKKQNDINELANKNENTSENKLEKDNKVNEENKENSDVKKDTNTKVKENIDVKNTN